METEIRNIEGFMKSKDHPKLAIMGGAKIRDAIKVARPFLENRIVDNIIFGGVAANIFLWASGVEIGKRNIEFIKKKIRITTSCWRIANHCYTDSGTGYFCLKTLC
jgi:3-phosphoglycerate kinase